MQTQFELLVDTISPPKDVEAHNADGNWMSAAEKLFGQISRGEAECSYIFSMKDVNTNRRYTFRGRKIRFDETITIGGKPHTFKFRNVVRPYFDPAHPE